MTLLNIHFTSGDPDHCPAGTSPDAPENFCKTCKGFEKCRQAIAKSVDIGSIQAEVINNSLRSFDDFGMEETKR